MTTWLPGTLATWSQKSRLSATLKVSWSFSASPFPMSTSKPSTTTLRKAAPFPSFRFAAWSFMRRGSFLVRSVFGCRAGGASGARAPDSRRRSQAARSRASSASSSATRARPRSAFLAAANQAWAAASAVFPSGRTIRVPSSSTASRVAPFSR